MNLIPDFGCIDYLHAFLNGNRKNHLIGNTSFSKKYSIKNPKREIWCIFLPWRTSYRVSRNIKILPENHIAYDGPASIVHPDPNVSRKSLFGVADDFEKMVLPRYEKVSILAFSASQYQAVWIANHFPIERLVLISPGSEMGKALWKSIGTRAVRRRSKRLGYKNGSDYDSVLKETNPIHQIRNLPLNTEIHLATHDKYVTYKHGLEFVGALRSAGKYPLLYTHYNKGHIMTMLEFGRNK